VSRTLSIQRAWGHAAATVFDFQQDGSVPAMQADGDGAAERVAMDVAERLLADSKEGRFQVCSEAAYVLDVEVQFQSAPVGKTYNPAPQRGG
jgi:hypothetical protein